MTNGIVWKRSPNDLAKDLIAWRVRLESAIVILAQYFAQKMQDEARRNAPWQDRTHAARGGLFGITELTAARDGVAIYLCHTMSYGVYLELANAGKYQILLPTIERNLPEIERQLKRLLS